MFLFVKHHLYTAIDRNIIGETDKFLYVKKYNK